MSDILFIKSNNASFIINDENILHKYFSVRSHYFQASRHFLTMLVSQFAELWWLIMNIWTCKIIYIWFADYHSLIPVIFARITGKKSVIVIGGFDVAKIPDIRYGGHIKPTRSLFIRLSLRLASLLLPVSQFTEQELIQINQRTPRKMVYNGVQVSLFHRDVSIPKQQVVLSVGKANNKWVFLKKGFDLFLEVARLLPDLRFILVGLEGEAAEYCAECTPGKNVQIYNQTSPSELLILYNQARVYCQFSRHESFCLALAEAMSCECVPVITRNGALPEVVGDTGYIVENRQADRLAAVIQRAMTDAPSAGLKARQHIEQNFTLPRREKQLIDILSTLVP
jgi:glycosyltransferase involved in cell wall biosynthesis